MRGWAQARALLSTLGPTRARHVRASRGLSARQPAAHREVRRQEGPSHRAVEEDDVSIAAGVSHPLLNGLRTGSGGGRGAAAGGGGVSLRVGGQQQEGGDLSPVTAQRFNALPGSREAPFPAPQGKPASLAGMRWSASRPLLQARRGVLPTQPKVPQS
jgi:hypothetical protein